MQVPGYVGHRTRDGRKGRGNGVGVGIHTGPRWGHKSAIVPRCTRGGERRPADSRGSTAGDLAVKIPKLRAGSFSPSLLERRRGVDEALVTVIMKGYLHGVSTRKSDDLVKALGADTGISKAEVKRPCATSMPRSVFRDRDPSQHAYPYVPRGARRGAALARGHLPGDLMSSRCFSLGRPTTGAGARHSVGPALPR